MLAPTSGPRLFLLGRKTFHRGNRHDEFLAFALDLDRNLALSCTHFLHAYRAGGFSHQTSNYWRTFGSMSTGLPFQALLMVSQARCHRSWLAGM